MRRTLTTIGALAFSVAAFSASAPANVWDDAAVRAFASIPIQEGGRIKPLDTFASVQLLKFNGKRSIRLDDGRKLEPTEWLLDCLFFPDTAKTYKTFLVENGDVMAMLSLPATKERDRYSYNDLAPARSTLSALAQQYAAIDDRQRTPAQSQLVNLAHNVFEFEGLVGYLDFARASFPVEESPVLAAVFENRAPVRLSDLLERAEAFRKAYMDLNSKLGHNESASDPDLKAMNAFLHKVDHTVGMATSLPIIPPPVGAQHNEWLTPASLLEHAFVSAHVDTQQVAIVRMLERMATSQSTAGVAADSANLNAAVVQLAKFRGEYGTVRLELAFYKLNLFWYSLYLYALSFVIVAVSWTRPKSAWLRWTAIGAVSLPTLLLSIGIVMRCIIRSRPPVTTLYETILFITAVAVIVALFIEFANRQRVGVSIGAAMGTLGIFLANKYELIERGDTMPSMVAVLDTNFWLSTHVTTVTMGYAAGLLASAIAHVFIFAMAYNVFRGLLTGRADAPQPNSDTGFNHSIATMTYGVLCFGLLFATLGTVLGGIWANNSWGRFWGWDPKENGALMIVLWQIIVLHARLARYIGDFGVAMSAIFGGMIVAFSWFGVNLLGVGLHSYGFTSGIATALNIFYGIEIAVLGIGAVAYVLSPVPKKTAARRVATAKPEPVHVK